MSEDKELETGFLSRWSKRKLEQPEPATEPELTDSHAPVVETVEQAETESSEELPVWQRDDVDAETKRQALRALFKKPEFNQRDGLNEYDDDFTQFASLGDVVTHEMKRMLTLAEEKLIADEDVDTDIPQEPDSDGDDKEDERLV